jgi:hypothetical protein
LGERRINPLAKPRFLLAPAQAFRQQQLVNAGALHPNPLDLAQVFPQAIERPARERQTELKGRGEGHGDDLADLLRRVCRGAAWSGSLL